MIKKKTHFEKRKALKKHFSTTKKHHDKKKHKGTLLFFKNTCWEDCIIDKDPSQITRETKEAIHIRRLDPNLNRNTGLPG